MRPLLRSACALTVVSAVWTGTWTPRALLLYPVVEGALVAGQDGYAWVTLLLFLAFPSAGEGDTVLDVYSNILGGSAGIARVDRIGALFAHRPHGAASMQSLGPISDRSAKRATRRRRARLAIHTHRQSREQLVLF